MNPAAPSGVPPASPSLDDGSYSASIRACREITRRHARSFYFSSHALPAGKRAAAYAIYAFCRHVDDQIDLAEDDAAATAALDRQRTLLDELETGGAAMAELPWAPAFVAVWKQYRIPRRYFDELLLGMTLDRGKVRIADWEELDRYCYLVAGVVGLIMTHLFVPLEELNRELLQRAAALGTAMQLTNILRDVGEDYARDRVYLPRTELESYGVTEADLAEGRTTKAFDRLMAFQIARARLYYLRSESGIALLPGAGTRRTVWMMREIYAAILERIEANGYDVFTRRARVNLAGKLALALRAWRKAARL